MILKLDNTELNERINLNLKRLSEYPYYSKEEIFAPDDYDWYADKEGRALLAFVCHYKISKTKIPAMDYLISNLGSRVNKLGYLGPIYETEVHEQQLSGHSWLLRGLCEYYEQFNDSSVLRSINDITDNLFIKNADRFKCYPVDRSGVCEGDVSGSVSVKLSEWILSTDIGCAFMSVDGLSHVFKITNRNDVRELVHDMAEVYLSIDKVKLKAQTHCTLTCARGLMRMYKETGETFYLDGAKEIFGLYTECGGMTLTYQNINWWGRPDTWTEPCAIVDSLILAAELYKAIDDEKYRVYAARIYHNGFATLQRIDGGAGTDSCVTSNGEHMLYAKMYDAYFCCTMRLAEGLWYIKRNAELLYAVLNGEVTKNNGVYTDGDIIYAYVTGGAEAYAEKFTEVDGIKLCPIVKYYKVPEDIIFKSKQQIVFMRGVRYMKHTIGKYVFETDTEYDISITAEETDENRTIADIKIDFKGETHPEPVKLRWQTSGNGAYTLWAPMNRDRVLRPNWNKHCVASCAASEIPVTFYIGQDGNNKVGVAVSDVKTPLKLKSGFIEENAKIIWELALFEGLTEEMTSYSVKILISEEDIPYEKSIENAIGWQSGFVGTGDFVPLSAFDAVYSTWYSYHQNVTADDMIKELETAARLGMKTVIIDDGWQTDDNSRGYAYCGEWTAAKTKIPDMKDFAGRVHGLGMKLMLWYSVPFVGMYSPVFERFKDKVLDPGSRKYFVLDPRYPDVREYLVRTYENAVREWDIDGMKLDFIDSFRLTEQSNPVSPQMDTVSVEEGVCRLLDEIQKAVTAIKPDILIEFRQSYIGPVMLKYGNMFRVADCPMDPITNRVGAVNLRLTCGNGAVHSDMIMWDTAETAQTAAESMINILFSVPQISVRINELPEEHYKMLENYMRLWNENRDVIMNGTIAAKCPEANYSIVSSEKDTRIFAVSYSDPVLYLKRGYTKIVFVNGTGGGKLYIENESDDANCRLEVFSCTGETIAECDMVLCSGINSFTVPVSGFIVLEKF